MAHFEYDHAQALAVRAALGAIPALPVPAELVIGFRIEPAVLRPVVFGTPPALSVHEPDEVRLTVFGPAHPYGSAEVMLPADDPAIRRLIELTPWDSERA